VLSIEALTELLVRVGEFIGREHGGGTVARMAPNADAAVADRVVELRRGVALARYDREAEGLSIPQIADRLGRSPATIKAYFYDPTREVKARYGSVPSSCDWSATNARRRGGEAAGRWR
jgi:hypothetical protein